MKLALTLILALFGFSAQAQTTTLTGQACSANCVCVGVASDADPAPDIDLSPVTVWLDGKAYALTGNVGTALDGSYITADLSFRRWTTKTVSGRAAGFRVQHCALTGGTVTAQ